MPLFVQICKLWSASKAENCSNWKCRNLRGLWTYACSNHAQFSTVCHFPRACASLVPNYLSFQNCRPGNLPWSTQHICAAFFMFILCVKVVDLVDFNSHSLWNSVLTHFMKLSARTAVSSKNFHEILAGCSLSCPFFHLPKSQLSHISFQWVCCQSTFLGKNLLFPSYTFPA